MKRTLFRIGKAGSVLALFVICGCIPSLQPFFTAKDVVFEPALIGSFSEDDKIVWTFSRGEDRSYKLVIRDEAKSSSFVAHMFRLGGERYLDLYAAGDSLDDCPREDFFKASLVPGHLVLRVPSISSTLKLQVLNEEWLKENFKGKSAVPHSLLEGERLVFTGSTEQMQAFLEGIAAEEKAWGKPAEFKRKNR
jgi:hypothetical protein